jgi:hypothetical protein
MGFIASEIGRLAVGQIWAKWHIVQDEVEQSVVYGLYLMCKQRTMPYQCLESLQSR